MFRLIGQTIHGYTFHERVGVGGYGMVYRARQEAVQRDVAIKVILPEYAQSIEFQERFAYEARLIAQLEHPHITPLYDYWQDESGAYLVMRYLRGGNLRQLLQEQGALSLSQATRLLTQIGEAFASAHEAGIVHRDLKPANILLDERSNAYVTDFGVATQLQPVSEGGTASAAQEDDVIVGTFAYLAPEQIQGEPLTQRCDIYALGLVLYEMLAGQHAYGNANINDLIIHQINDPVPSLIAIRPDLPVALDAIINRATSKQPDKRYATTQAMVDELNAIVQQGTYTPAPMMRIGSVPITIPDTSTQKLMRNLISTPESRNRRSMLQNVRAFWIEGVLEQSLHGAALIELGMTPHTTAVTNPWGIVLRRPGTEDRTVVPGTPVLQMFDRLNGKLLILGDPGSGKTTTLLELTQALLARAESDQRHAIPVVLNLSSWSQSRKPMTEWLVEELGNKYQVPRRVAERWVSYDDLLLLLDGLDEVAPAYRNDCVEAINTYRREHGFVDVVVCSRTVDYEALSNQLLLNGAIVLQPLTDQQVNEYLSQFGSALNTLRTHLKGDANLSDLSRSPLMLSIMALAYRDISQGALPHLESAEAQRVHLFDVYVARMFQRQPTDAAYSRDLTEYYLTWLAQQMVAQGQTVFQIENMQPDWLPEVQQSTYRFRFARVLTVLWALIWGVPRMITTSMAPPGAPAWMKGLTWGAAGSFWGVILGTRLVRYIWMGLLSGAAFSIAVALEGGLDREWSQIVTRIPGALIIYALTTIFALWLLRRGDHHPMHIRPVESVRFDRANVKLLMALAVIPAGAFTSVLNRIVFQRPDVTVEEQILGIVLGVITSVLTAGFLTGLTSNVVGQTTRPNEGIWRSLGNALRMGLFVAVSFGVILLVATVPVSSWTFGWMQVIVTALPFGAIGALIYGGYTVIQHMTLRRLLWQTGKVPRNYTHFLNYATRLILLRKVGGGYIFVHRYLLEYFATKSDLDTPETL
ncbi:protein kinase [Phototrophicus methaneseepsis]|uniref:non-specific serine/threonine protein kinase n=1 Tax=Phototrophicus methaneseepsis TaxID=2710758 RepID=A0A7S8ECG2_9CHLR|nr:protein kinase [Phototrophicus methaneseepsis]QPC84407.1 protein kinase [Phototrophicus methaneseepsis]